MQDFHFGKATDKSSPTLFLKCAKGDRLASVQIDFVRAGKTPTSFLKYTLSNVLISSYKTNGSSHGADDIPMEEVSLNFTKVEISYTPLDASGKSGAPIAVAYDLTDGRSD